MTPDDFNATRDRRVNTLYSDTTPTPAPQPAPAMKPGPPAAAAEPDHYDDAFDSLIADLPDAAQAALRLRFVEDLDYAGVARALGISPEAARQRVSTAIRALRAQGAAA